MRAPCGSHKVPDFCDFVGVDLIQLSENAGSGGIIVHRLPLTSSSVWEEKNKSRNLGVFGEVKELPAIAHHQLV